MLAGIVLAYNFSPALFLDLARTILNQAAQVVHEERLPYAFYGLTYLPLLLTLMIAGQRLTAAGSKLFSRPLRLFAVVLGCIMLAISIGHAKALFPVALCMTLAFGVQTALFRDGRLAVLGVLAWIMAAIGFVAFVQQVFLWPLPADPEICCLVVAAALLLSASRFLDQHIAHLLDSAVTHEWPGVWHSLCRTSSLALTAGLTAYSLVKHAVVPFDPAATLSGVMLLGLLGVHATLRNQRGIRLPVLVLMNWQALLLIGLLFGPATQTIFDMGMAGFLPMSLPLAVAAAASLVLWQGRAAEARVGLEQLVSGHLWRGTSAPPML